MKKIIKNYKWLPWNLIASWMVRRFPLRSLFKTGMLGVAWIFAILFLTTRAASVQYAINEEFIATSERIKDGISEKLLAPLLTGDYEAVQAIINIAMKDKNLKYIEVRLPSGVVGEDLVFKPDPFSYGKGNTSKGYDVPYLRDLAYPEYTGSISPSIYNASDFSTVDITNIGSVHLVLDFSDRLDVQVLVFAVAGICLLLIIFFALALSSRVQKEVSDPICGILRAMKEIESSDFEEQVDLPLSEQREISELISYSKNFNNTIVQRSDELKLLLQRQEEIINERTRDLTIALDKANQSAESKSNFISILSHELNQPLFASIMALTNMSRHEDISSNQSIKSYIDTVLNHLENAKSQIENVLDFTRNGMQSFVPKTQTFDVYKLIETIVSSHSSSAQSKGLYIDLIIGSHLPNMIVSCASGFQHIVNNLVGNAIKYTDKGGVTVYIEACDYQTPSKFQVKLVVSDTGIGIPESDQERIFEYYTQVGDATTRLQGGYGIGLAIVDNYIKSLNGNRYLTSDGSGSEFKITVPVERPAHALSAIQSNCIPLVASMNAMFVLYDTRQSWADGIRTRLENFNAECAVANNFSDIVSLMTEANKQKRPSVLILQNMLSNNLNNIQINDLKSFSSTLIIDLESFERVNFGKDNIMQLGADIVLDNSVAMDNLIMSCHKALSLSSISVQTSTRKTLNNEENKLQGCSVLLIDDNLSNLEFTREFLESHGAVVDIALGPESGLQSAIINEYDAICVDIMMPIINGIEVSQRIREYSVNSTKPIFAFTAAQLDKEKMQKLNLLNVQMIMKMEATSILVDSLRDAIFPGRL